jgi:hypothetical protein
VCLYRSCCWGLDPPNEAITLAIDCLDESLLAPTVPNDPAYGFDRTLQRRIADELLGPDLLAQLLLGDDPVGMRHQVGEHLEHFAPQARDLPSAAEHRALCVEGTFSKDVDHGVNPPSRAGRLPSNAHPEPGP